MAAASVPQHTADYHGDAWHHVEQLPSSSRGHVGSRWGAGPPDSRAGGSSYESAAHLYQGRAHSKRLLQLDVNGKAAAAWMLAAQNAARATPAQRDASHSRRLSPAQLDAVVAFKWESISCS